MVEFDDYQWLIGDEATALLATVVDDQRPVHQVMRSLRKTLSSPRATLIVQQLDLRNRATAKFGDAARRMFFLPQTLEQATDIWIARYKAARFSNHDAAWDYCTGIGGDLCGLAEHGNAVGCERDPATALLAEENLRRWPDARGDVPVRVGDAEAFPPPSGTPWHIDPDRRAGGRRTTTLEACQPGVAQIDLWRASAPEGVVKLAPATALPDAWVDACEAEWISRGRVCRQQLAWFAELAEHPGQRRATQISVDEQGTWSAASVAGQPGRHVEAADRCDAVLFEPDPAVIAAGLVGEIATRHGLAHLGAGNVYLTGPSAIAHPLLHAFSVEETLPMRTATVRKYLKARRVGTVEVKRRGVDVDPAAFRKALKLTGDESRTVVLTRIGLRPVAVVCQRGSGPVHDRRS